MANSVIEVVLTKESKKYLGIEEERIKAVMLGNQLCEIE